MSIHEFISEVRRCMLALMDTGDFPADTCPADVFTYCEELLSPAQEGPTC